MKKDRINTTSIREIKSSFKRFVSLLIMSMLGVGVFVGISSAAPNMMKSIDTYYDNTNTYDIKLVSTLGLTNDDIKKINSLKEIKKAYGTYSKDVLISDKENEYVVKINSINKNINQVDIKKGKVPKKSNEIVVEEQMLEDKNLKIGDKISIKDEDTFKNKEFIIVGVVKSPLYISNPASSDRGSTTIGNGKIDYYTYVNKNAFDIDYYTEIYVLVNNAKKELTNSPNYNNLIKQAIKSIENIKTNREKNRYDDIYFEAENKIKIEEEKAIDEFDDVKIKLDNTKKELDNGKISLDDVKKQLNNSSNKLNYSKEELDNNKIILDKAEEKLNNIKEELDLNKKYLNQAKEEIDVNKKLINEQLIYFNLSIDEINDIARIIEDTEIKRILDDNYDDIKEILKNNEDKIKNFVNDVNNDYTEEEIDSFLENIGLKDVISNNDDIQIIINLLKNKKEEVKKAVEEIYNKKSEIEQIFNIMQSGNNDVLKLFLSIIEINNADDKYNSSLNIYNKNLESYNTEYLKYKNGKEEYNKSYNLYLDHYNEYQQGLNQYNNNLKIYYSNLNLYNTKVEEYYNSRSVFDTKIKEAYDELGEISKCTWYIYERLDDSDYTSFIDDGNSVSNLSKVFPTIFFVVAILISLISMSRMVEDDRLLIGTLKSLGFSNKHIRKKYILYSLSATISGSIIGSLFGFFLLPRYIWNLYKLLFDVPIYKYDYNPKNIIIGTIIAIICICGTTLLTIKKVVKEKPSDLMRPKAPENGKRVILEKIPFIWNKINFSNKITIRNLFRYKKRVLMTVVGIFGCTALMLAGFGIRDSIVDIPNKQYKEIFYFDEMVYIKDDLSNDELNKLFSNKHIKNRVDTKMDVSLVSNNYPLNILVADNEQDIKYILDLRDVKTKKKLVLEDNKIIISDKLSQLTNKLEGDKLTITDSSNKNYEFVISGICENYVGHYVFMTKNTYEKYIDKYTTNVVYFNLDSLANEKKLTKKLLDNENIMSIMSVNNTVTNVNNMLKTLNSVVLILIFLSGALSFVVLYNLSYINISERKREIATLKVLGFTDKEVDNYITKETIILTILGIILGLLFGIFLSNIILDTVEIEKIRFMRIVNPISFVITTFIILLFTLLVNIITHYTLKKIDMIESLKSVE